jgi:hypothetical protein
MTFRRLHLFAALFSVAVGSTCFAIPYLDIQNPNAFITPTKGYAGIFSLVNPGSSTYTISGYSAGNGTFSDAGGYQVGTTLTNATASFYFADDKDTAIEKVDVFIGFFNGAYDQLLQNSSTTTISFGASPISLQILQTFGGINYVVLSDVGDFYLKYAKLTANSSTSTVPPATNVPDNSSTLVLLATAFLALLSFHACRGKLALAR